MNKQLLITGTVALALGVLIGGLIGHFATPTGVAEQEQEILDKYDAWMTDNWLDEDSRQWIIDNIKTENIETYLRFLSAETHLAGTPRDEELAEYFKSELLSYGFDWVEKIPSTFYLSRPNETNPNKIFIIEEGNITYTSHWQEDFQDANITDFVDAFLAYTPEGECESDEMVYANYGTIDDFTRLQELGINCTNRIVIMRYGKIYRGNKIDNAERYGASCAILFSDPDDVAREETVYPESWWLPESGMQRGSSFLGDGDPLTPGWPSTEHAYRIDPIDADFLGIPAQQIGYGDAAHFLELLEGDSAPEDWQGGLNLTGGYRTGPSLRNGTKIRLTTHNYGGLFKSYNVFGTIFGDVEPDRYVLIGNHRDAWGFGASDPSSGSAQLLETARVFGELKKNGWRPRRTLVFCSWGSEEYGKIGSTEWVEENVDVLQSRAVAYINTDTCATGPMLDIPSSPLLWDMILETIKLIPGVSDPTKTVYEELHQIHQDLYDADIQMSTLGSGSDFAHFVQYAGIPALDVWFRRDLRKHDISIYPSYHTGFETFEMVQKFNDPGFKYSQGCGRVAGLIAKQLADSLVLPYSLQQLPTTMKKSLESFNNTLLSEIYSNFKYFGEAIDELLTETKNYTAKLKEMKSDPITLRTVNDQMMKFEQSFILPAGLPNRPVIRHAVFAPSQFDSYASVGFPGLSDLLYGYDDLTLDEKAVRDIEISRHISDLTILTQRATQLLRELHKF